MIKPITSIITSCLLCGLSYGSPDSTIAGANPLPLPRVESVQVFHSGSGDSSNSLSIGKKNEKVAYAGNIICFHISNPRSFLKSKPMDQSKVVLYINGIEMPGVTTEWYSQVTTRQLQADSLPDFKGEAMINIQLVRDPGSQKSWDFLYSNTDDFTKSYFDVAHASVGWEHMSALDKGQGDDSLTIAFYHHWEFWAWSILYIIIFVTFISLAKCTDVLKATHQGPFSLSNTQLLLWTSLVMGAFIYTLLLTDISMSFNTSILYMLGISLGTTGVATAIDQNKFSAKTAVPKKPQGFFKDLLTDGDSYSIQRIQTFAWNIILAAYFVSYTVRNKTMPEFPTPMLLLAGFSSTSYLTGKISENTTTTAAAQQAQAAVAPPDPQNANKI